MCPKTAIQPQGSPAAVGPYSPAVRAGDFLFCSGQIPIDPHSGNLVSGDIQAQTARVLENVQLILKHEKLDWADVVKATNFLVDMSDFSAMNEAYARFFQRDFPARTTLQVAGLPKGARIEIEIIAHYPRQAP
jgi:2-iminobutanoate/2-iminopropanoate deaminase